MFKKTSRRWLILLLLVGILPALVPREAEAAINWGKVNRDLYGTFDSLEFSVSSPGIAQVFFRTEQLVIYPGPGYGQNAVFDQQALKDKGFYSGGAGIQTISFNVAELAQKMGISEQQICQIADNSGFTLGAVLGIYNGSKRISEITRPEQVDTVCGPSNPTCGYTFPLASRNDMRSRWGIAYDPQKPIKPRTLTVQIEGQGTTTPEGSASGITYVNPKNPTGLVAFPATGWKFSRWEDVTNGTTLSTSPNTSVMISTSRTVKAVFVEDKVVPPPPPGQPITLTMKIAGQGSTNPTGSSSGIVHSYTKGDTVDCYAVPADGWHFVKWQETNETNKHIKVSMTTHQVRTAIFEKNRGEYAAVWLYIIADKDAPMLDYEQPDMVFPDTYVTPVNGGMESRSGTIKQEGFSMGDTAILLSQDQPEERIQVNGAWARRVSATPPNIYITDTLPDPKNPPRFIHHQFLWYRWEDARPPKPVTGTCTFYHKLRRSDGSIIDLDQQRFSNVSENDSRFMGPKAEYTSRIGGVPVRIIPDSNIEVTLTVTLFAPNPTHIFWYSEGPFNGWNLGTRILYGTRISNDFTQIFPRIPESYFATYYNNGGNAEPTSWPVQSRYSQHYDAGMFRPARVYDGQNYPPRALPEGTISGYDAGIPDGAARTIHADTSNPYWEFAGWYATAWYEATATREYLAFPSSCTRSWANGSSPNATFNSNPKASITINKDTAAYASYWGPSALTVGMVAGGAEGIPAGADIICDGVSIETGGPHYENTDYVPTNGMPIPYVYSLKETARKFVNGHGYYWSGFENNGVMGKAMQLMRFPNDLLNMQVKLPVGWKVSKIEIKPGNGWTPAASVNETLGETYYLSRRMPAVPYSITVWVEKGSTPDRKLLVNVYPAGAGEADCTTGERTSPSSGYPKEYIGGYDDMGWLGRYPIGISGYQTIQAVPNPGWEFKRWEVTGNSNHGTNLASAATGVNMDESRTVTAIFGAPTFTLFTSTAGAGNGTISPAGVTEHSPGTTVAVTATPAADSYFVGFIGDLAGMTNPQNIYMDRNKSVTAVFDKKPVLTLQSMSVQNGKGAAVASPGGSPPGPSGSNRVEPPVNPVKVNTNEIGKYNYNQEVTLTAEPAANGSFFVEWREGSNVISTDLVYKIRMTGDRTITAVFSKNPIFIPATPPKRHWYIVK